MDFLLVANHPPYPLHILERNALYQLASELASRHYVIDLLCFYSEPEDIAEVPRYEPLFRRVQIIPKPAHFPIQHRLKSEEDHFPKAAKAAWSAEMWQTLHEWVNDRAYSFAQLVGDFDIYEYHPIIKRIPNLIQSFHIPSQTAQYQLSQTSDAQRKRLLSQTVELAQKAEPWLYSAFEGRVVTTETQAQYLRKLMPEQSVEVIPIGVDTEYYVATGHDPHQPTLLFIGDFEDQVTGQAALRLCERIFPTVKRAIPNASLLILGNKPPRYLKPFASESVIFVEKFVDLRHYFELSTVMVCPHPSSIGFQHHILKALAMMTPIVATAAALEGCEKLHHDRDVMIANGDDDLIRATIRLLREDQTRLRLQLNGRERLNEYYSWQHIGDLFEDLHTQITRQHGFF